MYTYLNSNNSNNSDQQRNNHTNPFELWPRRSEWNVFRALAGLRAGHASIPRHVILFWRLFGSGEYLKEKLLWFFSKKTSFFLFFLLLSNATFFFNFLT